MSEADAVTLATLQNKLVASEPAVPNPGLCWGSLFPFPIRHLVKFRLHNSDTDLPQQSHEGLLLTPISELEGLVVHLISSLSQRTLNKIYTCYWWEGTHQHITIQWDVPVFFLTEENLNGQHRATTWKKQVLIHPPPFYRCAFTNLSKDSD